MRKPAKKDRSRLIKAALGKIPCDLCVENIQLCNMFTGEIYPASVDVLDGVIVRVREKGMAAHQPAAQVHDGKGAYLVPGFIDTHMHVESTMMIPENLGRAIVPWGTTTVCTDPHEIGNVMGLDGVKFMLENGKKSALRQYALAPSSVPSVPGAESTGAVFTAKEVGDVLDMPGVLGIAEVMDFVGVINDSQRMHSIVDEGIKRGMYLQGHAPTVTGAPLAAYRIGGPRSDHESGSAAETQEKLRMGIHVNLRASSLVDQLHHLVEGFKHHGWYDYVSICTDDVHASDLLHKGHINWVVKKCIEYGIEPLMAYKLATINAAREYGFDDLGAIAPGYWADMQLLRQLDGRAPEAVFIAGKLVAQNGQYTGPDAWQNDAQMPNTVHMDQLHGPEDFLLAAPAGAQDTVWVNCIKCDPEHPVIHTSRWVQLPVVDGHASLDGVAGDFQFISVVNRYGAGNQAIALMEGFNLKEGAYATTVSHDSHNFTVVYRDAADAYAAAQELAGCGGGITMVAGGQVIHTLKLPVAGLMSTLPCPEITREIDEMEAVVQRYTTPTTRVLATAILSLPVFPGTIITDVGLIDGESQQQLDVILAQPPAQ